MGRCVYNTIHGLARQGTLSEYGLMEIFSAKLQKYEKSLDKTTEFI